MTVVKDVQCCIAGGGPAGLMLGFLLARAGLRVAVLEKHADFLRDFRGDTIHPSTMEIMSELGLLDRFLKIPHQKVPRLVAQFGDFPTTLADFSTLPVKCPYIAMMPQWDFLNFLAEEARAYAGFSLLQRTEAYDLIEDNHRVVGVRASGPEGDIEVRAPLVVGADGRDSILRDRSGLEIEELGAPMDALWFRLSRSPSDTEQTQVRFDLGRIFVMLNRGDYWQCAYLIAKGSLDDIKARGLDSFRAGLGAMLPFERSRANEITTFDDLKLLTVRVDRLKKWYRPGLLFIGDAAHAMSPVGGVGINLAIQDAVAAANILAVPLLQNEADSDTLRAVQNRRMLPTRIVQAMQVGSQNSLIAPTLAARDGGETKPPLAFRLLARFPILRRIPARLVGLGVRPEHVAPFIRMGGTTRDTSSEAA